MIITEPKGVAIVTGASRGIGREIAISLTAAKYQVAALARSEIDLFETIRLTEKVGPRAVPFLAEVTNEEQVSRTVSEIEEAMGPVNLLVNNAGVMGPTGLIWDTSFDLMNGGNVLILISVDHSYSPKRFSMAWSSGAKEELLI